MTIDRRAFVAGTALMVVAPIRGLAMQPSSSAAAAMRPVVFMIDGWSVGSDDDTVDQVWIRIGHGWRSAWR
jgi:hypothetical protein